LSYSCPSGTVTVAKSCSPFAFGLPKHQRLP